MVAAAGHPDKQFRPCRTYRRQQKQDGCQHKRRLPPVPLADPAGKGGAQDATDQGTAHNKAFQCIRLVQGQPERFNEEFTQRLDRPGNHRCIISE